MSNAALAKAPTDSTLVIRPLRDASLTALAVLIALLTLYAVFLDQGQLLSPVMGKIAQTVNYIHEFAHDGRHLFGAPCH